MPLLKSKPEPLGSGDLEDLETDELLRAAQRYEAELEKRRAAFENPRRTGRIKSLDEYHRIERFLDGEEGDR